MWLRWMDEMLVRSAEGSGDSGGAPQPAAGDGSPPASPAAPTAVEASLLTDAAAAPADPAAVDPNKPADPAKPEEKAEEPALKPEDYKLDLPAEIPADDPLLQKFLKGAAAGGMDNESVNAVIKELAPELRDMALAPIKAWKDMNTQWAQQVAEHPEIGGANQTAAMATIVRAMNKFMPEGEAGVAERAALNQALLTTGSGNNPHILAWVHRMAKQLVEPTAPVLGTSGNPAARDPLRAMYPTHFADKPGG